jgi:serine/threonine-protein kinase
LFASSLFWKKTAMPLQSVVIDDLVCSQCGADLSEIRKLSTPPPLCVQCRFPIIVIAGKYRILRLLGKGGFGSVYLARHVQLERNADRVVKVIRIDAESNPTMPQRFYREVQVTSDLSQRNEHIVRIYDDFGEVPQLGHFYVMEYLQGNPLTCYTENRDNLPSLPWIADVFGQLCDAIQAAHEEGIIHRDLKPDNILLIERRNQPYFVKVLDFGIARPIDSEDRPNLQLTQGALGTPLYMPPEQVLNKSIDARSDLYALGIILYELLTGSHPFVLLNMTTQMSQFELLAAQLMSAPRPFKERRPGADLPEGLEFVVQKALAKVPEERYQSVDEFWQAVWYFLADRVPTGYFLADRVQTPTKLDPTAPHKPFPPQPHTHADRVQTPTKLDPTAPHKPFPPQPHTYSAPRFTEAYSSRSATTPPISPKQTILPEGEESRLAIRDSFQSATAPPVASTLPPPARASTPSSGSRRSSLLSAILILALISIGGAWWFFFFRQPVSHPSAKTAPPRSDFIPHVRATRDAASPSIPAQPPANLPHPTQHALTLRSANNSVPDNSGVPDKAILRTATHKTADRTTRTNRTTPPHRPRIPPNKTAHGQVSLVVTVIPSQATVWYQGQQVATAAHSFSGKPKHTIIFQVKHKGYFTQKVVYRFQNQKRQYQKIRLKKNPFGDLDTE